MVTKNQCDTLDEKKLDEKQKQNLLKKLTDTPFATMLVHGHIGSPMEITTTEGSNLIPRVINTHIQVYAITVDIVMDSSRSRYYYNFQNVMGANNNAVNSIIDLHKAASCGNKVGVEDAIHRDRELLKLSNSDGNLPLHLAVANGHREVAFILVKAYPQGSYALNTSNISPLYHAVLHKDTDLVKVMFHDLATHEKDHVVLDNLKRGNSILRAAITNQDQETLKIILKSQRDLIKCTDEKGLTPLSYAAYKGFVEMVEYIIEKFPKSVSNYKNQDKSEPIHKACEGGHLQVLEMLVSKSSKSLRSEAELGRTVLHLAAKKPRNALKDIALYLLTLNEGRELIQKEDEYGCTPLDLAITSNNTEIQQLIRRCMPC